MVDIATPCGYVYKRELLFIIIVLIYRGTLRIVKVMSHIFSNTFA